LSRGIETRPFFVPLHLMPPYRRLGGKAACPFPIAEKLGRTGINLPTYIGLTDDMVEFICQVVRDAHRS
jgi:perosamine synthetase